MRGQSKCSIYNVGASSNWSFAALCFPLALMAIFVGCGPSNSQLGHLMDLKSRQLYTVEQAKTIWEMDFLGKELKVAGVVRNVSREGILLHVRVRGKAAKRPYDFAVQGTFEQPLDDKSFVAIGVGKYCNLEGIIRERPRARVSHFFPQGDHLYFLELYDARVNLPLLPLPSSNSMDKAWGKLKRQLLWNGDRVIGVE